MRPPEINFKDFPMRIQLERYLNRLPSWYCQNCKAEVHPTMKSSYKLAREAYPLCIPCYERSLGKEIHGVDVGELKKVAELLS